MAEKPATVQDAIHLHEIEPIEWAGSLVLVAFPTMGSVASIAGHYLQQRLDLPLIGSLYAEHQLPVVAVRDGIATSPIRVFGGEVECSLPDGKCPRVHLIVSDLMLDPPLMDAIGRKIMSLAKDARLLLALDGVARERDDETPDVFSVAARRDVLESLSLANVKQLPEAILAGMAAQLLLKAPNHDVRVAALVVEASAEIPDGRAAAALIQAVDQLIPEIAVDPEPLLEEAMKLERAVQKLIAEQQRAADAGTAPAPLRSFV